MHVLSQYLLTHTRTPSHQASRTLARISGQLQSAAALLVELARAASASSVEVSGSNPLLTANTAAVLQQQQGGDGGRLVPAFPTLYPQLPPGMAGERGPATGEAGKPTGMAYCTCPLAAANLLHDSCNPGIPAVSTAPWARDTPVQQGRRCWQVQRGFLSRLHAHQWLYIALYV